MTPRLVSKSPQFACCVVLMYLTAAGYHLLAQPAKNAELLPLGRPLDTLPMTLGRWSGADVPLGERAILATEADAHISRYYTSDTRAEAFLYVCYYGAPYLRWPHDPSVCYKAGGWTRLSNRTGTITADGRSIPVNNLLFERTAEQKAVQHWYVDTDVPVSSVEPSKLRYVKDALQEQQRYVLQVHIASPVTSSAEKAFANCDDLAAALWPELRKCFPKAPIKDDIARIKDDV